MGNSDTSTRVAVSRSNAAEVLIRSRRRCCLCYFWKKDLNQKDGQLAHIDRDHTHSQPDNLAYLCLDHHNEYDAKHLQSKNITPDELRFARTQLYERMGAGFEPDARVTVTIELDREFRTFNDDARDEVLDLVKGALDNNANVRIVGIRSGSVRVTFEMNSSDALKIVQAIQRGDFEQIDAVDAELEAIADPPPEDYRRIDFSLETEKNASVVFDLLRRESPHLREYGCAILGQYIEHAPEHIQERAVSELIDAHDRESEDWIRAMICQVLFVSDRPEAKSFLEAVDKGERAKSIHNRVDRPR